jgi:hypothetical protein
MARRRARRRGRSRPSAGQPASLELCSFVLCCFCAGQPGEAVGCGAGGRLGRLCGGRRRLEPYGVAAEKWAGGQSSRRQRELRAGMWCDGRLRREPGPWLRGWLHGRSSCVGVEVGVGRLWRASGARPALVCWTPSAWCAANACAPVPLCPPRSCPWTWMRRPSPHSSSNSSSATGVAGRPWPARWARWGLTGGRLGAGKPSALARVRIVSPPGIV